MTDKIYNLDEFNMSDAELFAPVNHDELESEKITAPRYSYWASVFRVFFRNKLNTVMLILLAVILVLVMIVALIVRGIRRRIKGKK